MHVSLSCFTQSSYKHALLAMVSYILVYLCYSNDVPWFPKLNLYPEVTTMISSQSYIFQVLQLWFVILLYNAPHEDETIQRRASSCSATSLLSTHNACYFLIAYSYCNLTSISDTNHLQDRVQSQAKDHRKH